MTEPLVLNGCLKLWPDTLLSLRLAADSLEIVTTEGAVRITGQHLPHLMRLLLHGQIQQLKDNDALRFGCQVDTVTLSPRRPLPRQLLPFPDSCPAPAGWLCIQGRDFADYHPAASLQIIAAQGRRFLLGFAQNSYQTSPFDGEAETLRQGLIEDFGQKVTHLSAWTPEAYLPWPPSRRLHAEAIGETAHRPDCWDEMDTFRDLRSGPEQSAFSKRLPVPAAPAIGHDR